MTRAQRIKRISDLADMTKRVASQRLTSSRQRHDGNLAKLAEFRRYLSEYSSALRQPGAAMSAASAREIRGFIVQLERTINALEAHTQRSGQECARELEAWQREAHRASALLDVLARASQADHTSHENRQQRELDDRAQRIDQ